MAYAMTKQGSLDNCITYEFICDTIEDMNAIEDRYRTIGTIAIVLSGSSGLEVYIAGSDKQWNSLSTIGGSSGAGSAGLAIHICGQNEVSEGLPNVSEPDETTIYLVPAEDEESGNLYDEYIYVDGDWERFGSGGSMIDLTGYYQKPVNGIPASDLASGVIPDVSIYAPIASPVFTGSISLGREDDTTVGNASFAVGIGVEASGAFAHAEGSGTTASGGQSHAEGNGTTASGNNSHAEGGGTAASGVYAHAEGTNTQATDFCAHAEGSNTTASGSQSHAEGNNTTASGSYSHAEGGGTTASSLYAHAEGASTQATNVSAHAEGSATTASGTDSHAEGNSTIASGSSSHAEGMGGAFTLNSVQYTSEAKGTADHVEGYMCLTASGQPGNHAEGFQTRATGGAAHAEGQNTLAQGMHSHAEGSGTTASGSQSHAEGSGTIASGDNSHVEGGGAIASGALSHAEGANTKATNFATHAEGAGTTASSWSSHAEGSNTTASNTGSHAEGSGTTASGNSSHAEGSGTTASGIISHAEGSNTIASGVISHAAGTNTIASGAYQCVCGMFNVEDSYVNWPEWTASTSYAIGDKVKVTTTSDNNTTITGYICKTANNDSSFVSSKWINQGGKINYIEIVGNGTDENARSNARALDWSGNEYLMGDIYVGCNADSTGGAKVVTEAVLASLINRIAALESKVAYLEGQHVPDAAVTDETGAQITDESSNFITYNN